ncbi:MAG: hypothetical protein AAF495_08095 [Pseudomonadota bacterium]
MAGPGPLIRQTVGAELAQSVSPAVAAMSEAIVQRHGAPVEACLFYGSCLRDKEDRDRVLDFYLLASDYRSFHGRWWPALLNRLLPPSVYYIETPFEGRTLRAKYAVLSLADFERRCTARALLPTLWARMAQPCALIYAKSDRARARMTEALARAVETTAEAALPLMASGFAAPNLWVRAFRESYRTELRAERPGRAEQLVASYGARYESFGTDWGRPTSRQRAAATWLLRRLLGRIAHVLRLIKTAHTFTNGLDYVLWKIEQHSGVHTEPTPWQRRHPILAAPLLAWRLYRAKAIR